MPGERDWSLPDWDPSEVDTPTKNTETERPQTKTVAKFKLGKAPPTDSPAFLEWLSGVVYRIDAESEIRHQFYRTERAVLETLKTNLEATATAVQTDVASLKEAVGEDAHPDPKRPTRILPATGLVATVAALKEDVGEEPDQVQGTPGTGIKGRLATILDDRRFYRVLLTTASGIVVLLQAVRVIYGLATGHP